MTFYVDTSAFVALVIAEDCNFAAAQATWERMLNAGDRPVSSNYNVVETFAVLRRRSGLDVARRFVEDILPVVMIEWIDPGLHSSALTACLSGGRRGPSIVDCVSFMVMHRLGIRQVFAFDPHFGEQGFEVVP